MSDDPTARINIQLAQDLCLEAGRIMEDVSAEMALALPRSAERINARVENLHAAAEQIMALATAARALVRL